MNDHYLTALLLFGLIHGVCAQQKEELKMDFEVYDPPSTLVVDEHKLTRAKFPFIDIHNHQGDMTSASTLHALIAEMDKLNMAVMVNLSGRGFRRSGDHLEKSIEAINQHYPKRFILFTNIDFSDIDNPEWPLRTVKQLEADVKRGAMGLKIYKSLGMSNRDNKGNRIAVDDPRMTRSGQNAVNWAYRF
jgi:hypothetical protein